MISPSKQFRSSYKLQISVLLLQPCAVQASSTFPLSQFAIGACRPGPDARWSGNGGMLHRSARYHRWGIRKSCLFCYAHRQKSSKLVLHRTVPVLK